MKITINYTPNNCSLRVDPPTSRKEILAVLCASVVETGKMEIENKEMFLTFITNLLDQAWEEKDVG